MTDTKKNCKIIQASSRRAYEKLGNCPKPWQNRKNNPFKLGDFMHNVVQVIPQNDFTVIVYFENGEIKKYDAKHLLNKGVFKEISDEKNFMEKCTVLNNTLAWDLSGTFDPYSCIDIDPETVYEDSIAIKDPLIDRA